MNRFILKEKFTQKKSTTDPLIMLQSFLNFCCIQTLLMASLYNLERVLLTKFYRR